jgi:hypothetical protein
MDEGAVGFAKMMSVFAGARLLGAPVALAYAAQAVVTLAVAATLAWAAWRARWTPALGAMMLAGAPLATPFVLDYDLVLIAFPLMWLAGREEAWSWERIAIALAFAAPAFARPLALNVGIPLMPVVLLALFALVTRRTLAESGKLVATQGAAA